MKTRNIKWLFFDIGSTLIDETACEEYRRAHKGAAWSCHLEKLYPQTISVLEYLHGNYCLGIIANQVPGTDERLRAFGIRGFFDIIAASGEEGVHKPDPEIFRRALSRAGCSPGESVMIGDRPDNDMLPAMNIGMGTILIHQGIHASDDINILPRNPDAEINGIEEIVNIL